MTWYYGTITWTDSSLDDLSDVIITSNPSVSNDYYNRQVVFRIIFITESSINGYHPYDAGDTSLAASQITAYSYSNGVHSITFYYARVDWTSGVDVGRIQFRYLNGTNKFRNLSAFDLVNVSSGTLSKATSTERYDMYNTWGGDITIHAKYTVS